MLPSRWRQRFAPSYTTSATTKQPHTVKADLTEEKTLHHWCIVLTGVRAHINITLKHLKEETLAYICCQCNLKRPKLKLENETVQSAVPFLFIFMVEFKLGIK